VHLIRSQGDRLEGDSLTVEYNVIMQLTDFEDAVYVLVR